MQIKVVEEMPGNKRTGNVPVSIEENETIGLITINIPLWRLKVKDRRASFELYNE
jgi:hypothetical protein